jgi:hypothetical protein
MIPLPVRAWQRLRCLLGAPVCWLLGSILKAKARLARFASTRPSGSLYAYYARWSLGSIRRHTAFSTCQGAEGDGAESRHHGRSQGQVQKLRRRVRRETRELAGSKPK